MEYNRIIAEIEKKKFYPVYFLFGEEPYFIDKITRLLENTVLEESQKSFNQDVVYGSDMTVAKLNSLLRSYPVMSPYKVVLLKEAQKMKKSEWDFLENYLKAPAETTIFVIAFKDKKMDGRLKVAKLLKDGAKIITLESKKLYENKMPDFIQGILKEKGFEADPIVTQMLVDAYGTNLSFIVNEVEKLSIQLKFLNLKKITKDFVYDFVNIDRDFNVFELQDAIGQKNLYKSYQIIDHLGKNPKDNPAVMVVHNIFSYFNKLAMCKYARTENDQDIANIIGVSPFIARNYKPGLRNYSLSRLRENLIHISEADLKIKGIRTTQMNDEHILKTLINQLVR